MGTQQKERSGNPVTELATGFYKASVFLWSMFPGDIASNKTCLYTTHLFTGQTRNNYLHETGHALGLLHESNFQWRVDGASELATVGAGRHTLTLRFTDQWGRVYSGSTVLEVLSSTQEYDNRTAAMTHSALL